MNKEAAEIAQRWSNCLGYMRLQILPSQNKSKNEQIREITKVGLVSCSDWIQHEIGSWQSPMVGDTPYRPLLYGEFYWGEGKREGEGKGERNG